MQAHIQVGCTQDKERQRIPLAKSPCGSEALQNRPTCLQNCAACSSLIPLSLSLSLSLSLFGHLEFFQP